MSMVIRLCRHEDIDQIVELGRGMHEESAYSFLPYDPEKVRRLAIDMIEHPETRCGLVAEQDHAVVAMLGGYLTDYFFCDEDIACDMVLFVDRDYRGSPAAAKLIQGFRNWAIARGARELCLSISTNVSTESIGRLYKGLGFTQVGAIYKQRL